MSNGGGIKQNSSFVCQSPGCERSFSRSRDLARHYVVHDETSPKRRCPYPDTQCRLETDEKYQLSNWYEHLITVHSRYKFGCESCKERFKNRKELYAHHESTGHVCVPSQWSDTWRERELAEKNCCYRETRAQLLQMRERGVQNAWDDSWPETLPEYTKFMNSKRRQHSSCNRNHPSLSGNLPESSSMQISRSPSIQTPQSSSMQIPSNKHYRGSDGCRELRRKQRRHQPYVSHVEPSTASKPPVAGTSHMGAEDSSESFSHLANFADSSHTATLTGDAHINHNLTFPEGTFTFSPSASVPPLLGDPDVIPNSDPIMTQAEFQQLWDDLWLAESAPSLP